MSDAFWTNLPATIAAVVAAITAFAAWFQSFVNGYRAKRGEKKLQENTELTAIAVKQTNGASERNDKIIDSLTKSVAANAAAIQTLQHDVAEIKDAVKPKHKAATHETNDQHG